jgi:4-aminobutyrate aminotransferase-like enzyme
VLLVCDEILTGLGRTGRWFACEHTGVVPDLLCVGKALGGGLPLSACIGTPEVMAAWGRSTGEAHHTSTFLGNPLACAAAVATLDTLRDEEWPDRVAVAGAEFGARLHELTALPGVDEVRGIGFLWGAELRRPNGEPDAARAFAIVRAAMRRGVLVLADGSERNVLSFTPPYLLSAEQRDVALQLLREAILEMSAP